MTSVAPFRLARKGAPGVFFQRLPEGRGSTAGDPSCKARASTENSVVETPASQNAKSMEID
jgi:hypothetical protein